MTKAISRRKFLQVMTVAHAAVAAHLLLSNAPRAAAQDEPWDEQSPAEAPGMQPLQSARSAFTTALRLSM
jgi:hypothetical protein